MSGGSGPALLIIARPNGSGKSTVYRGAKFVNEGRDFWIINPDLLAARINQLEQLDLTTANLQAVQRIEQA